MDAVGGTIVVSAAEVYIKPSASAPIGSANQKISGLSTQNVAMSALVMATDTTVSGPELFAVLQRLSRSGVVSDQLAKQQLISISKQ